ncbi:putative F-box/LRR-repeat protein At3g28410 [Quercus suber]|uniref:putative F-box/LRR-repeat protein At3g28410 n=1 Tax=Quercus suber TaxID=58331 RepID=UPI0032DEBCE7
MERHVMDEKICAVDRISDLPEFILHHIFSLLYRKEAAKTGLLSKKWNCVWSSFPIFDFDQMHYFNLHSPCVPDTRPESQNRVEKFMNDVDKSISRFHVHQLPMQKFILNMTLFDFKLASLVDKWIGMALEHDVKEIDLQVQTKRNTWYCLPGTIFVAKSTNNCKLEQPFSWCALNYYSLQKLWLSHICVNEEIIQDIFRSCPFITDFGLIGCYGLKTLDISKLPKLCSVEVYSLEQTVEILRVEAANLEYFRFSYSDDHIDTLWLHKLREFLVMSNQRNVLTLRIMCQEVAFSLEELKGITIPPSFELELNYDARSTNITTVHRNNRSWKSYRWLALELLSKKTVIANRFGVPRELHKGMIFLLLDFRVPLLD